MKVRGDHEYEMYKIEVSCENQAGTGKVKIMYLRLLISSCSPAGLQVGAPKLGSECSGQISLPAIEPV